MASQNQFQMAAGDRLGPIVEDPDVCAECIARLVRAEAIAHRNKKGGEQPLDGVVCGLGLAGVIQPRPGDGRQGLIELPDQHTAAPVGSALAELLDGDLQSIRLGALAGLDERVEADLFARQEGFGVAS